MRLLSLTSLIILLVANCKIVSGQQLKLIRTQFIGGVLNNSIASDAITTSDNGILVGGITYDIGSGDIPAFPVRTDSGSKLLIKLDSLGNKQWVKVNDRGGVKGICQTQDGGYALLTGNTNRKGDISFDRVDSMGNLLWSASFGSSRPEGIFDIICTPDKGFLIFGMSLGADGDIPFNYTTPPVTFQPADWVLIKTDSFGNKQWVKVFGSTEDESFGGTVLCDGTYYYLIASAKTKDHDCVDSLRLAEGFTGFSPYVIKLDTLGNKVWSKAYGGGVMSGAFFDPRDSTILGVGTCTNSYEFQGNHGSIGEDMFLFKIDRDGQFKWAKLFGDIGYDIGEAATVNPAPGGGYYLTGISNPFPGTTSIGGQDGWLFLTDSVGNLIAKKLFGSIKDEFVRGVVPVRDGIVVIGDSRAAGFTEGAAEGFSGGPENVYVAHFHLWPLNVKAPKELMSLKIYPNPATHQLMVELPTQEGSHLDVFNASGRLVHQEKLAAGIKRLAISMRLLQAGIYTVCWQSNGAFEPLCQKLVIR